MHPSTHRQVGHPGGLCDLWLDHARLDHQPHHHLQRHTLVLHTLHIGELLSQQPSSHINMIKQLNHHGRQANAGTSQASETHQTTTRGGSKHFAHTVHLVRHGNL